MMHQSRTQSNSRSISRVLFQVTSTALLGAACFVVPACKKKPVDDSVIRIGEVGSMTGSESTFGISTHNGILLAAEEINARGGIKGKRVEIILLDDQGKPEEAATAITKLISQEKVTAVLGEVASSRSLAMAPIAQNAKIPMISPSSTNPKVTETGDFIFRTCFIDPFQGTVMAKFAFNNLKLRKVGILTDVKNDYSVGLTNYFKAKFMELGGAVLIEQSYSSGDSDFKAQLTAIRAQGVDSIYLPGYYTEVGLIARQAKELGLQVPLMGGDGWDSSKLNEIGGAAVVGHYFSNHYSPEDQKPEVQNFISKFKAKFGGTPDAMSALGYDALMLLAASIEKAPTLAGTDIRDVLAKTKDFQGVAGKVTMDEKRNATKSAVVLKVSATGSSFVTSIDP